MLRKTLGIILIILGLASAGFGVASATVWRESDSVVATATPKGDGTLVVTDPGVLELVGPDVTVRATVPDGGTVALAIGRDVDVDGWIGIDHSTRIHGLTDWTTLETSAVVPEIPPAAEGEEAPTPTLGANPYGNDMWVADAGGQDSVSLRWTDRPGRWSLLAAGVGEGAVAPTIELTWPREATTPLLWPAVGAAAALLLVGLLLLLVRRRRPTTVAAGDAPGDAPVDASTEKPTATTPGDAARTSRAPGPSGRWPGATVAAPAGAEPTDEQQPEATATPREEGEAEQRPGRSALMSRRSRRRAAPAEPPVEDAQTAGSAVDEAQPAPEPSAPAGRRWGFTPVLGGSATEAQQTPEPSPALAPQPPTAQAPQQAPGPQAAYPAPTPQAPGSEPLTATGAIRLTRRELRAQEEARRAAEQTGITGRLRALTGSIPAVRPAPAQPPVPDPDAPPTRASRSQAWRQAWGFDPEAGSSSPTDTDTEGGAR